MSGEAAGDVARARDLLRERFAADAADVAPVAGGVFSRAYGFTAGGRRYVVRFNAVPQADESFAKDVFAGEHFASAALPIPRVVATGRAADEFYAISERVAGRTLHLLPTRERLAVLPAALDTLDAVARADLRATRGYGPWGADGAGRFATWRDALAACIEDETAGFYQDWHALFRDSSLERDVYELVYGRMLRLAAACPEDRALLHCDYHFKNILADGGRISGVIDWGNAWYGDPLYDVARVGWWAELADAAVLRARYGAAPRYDERIACYCYHLGLDDLRYYAKTGQRKWYDWTRNRLLALVAWGAGGVGRGP
ncbi:MAG TPA: aminoglycoside phosphotransferase family protein [Thermomicrobiales bacterium]|nr:aminoglycoside phosphotransferase family protein [Thermomicrobiales bacterium]